MKDFWYKIGLALFPTAYYLCSRIWLSTCRLTILDQENIEAAQEQGAVIAPFWHYSIVYLFHHLCKYGGTVLVSASRDGEFVARTAERFGLEAVRGSSNRQGVQALKKLLKAMKKGKHIGIVADGSQGPARVLQQGAVYLASKTGAPILPMAWSADRYKAFNSWDRTVLPMLFARITLCYGKPMNIPPDLDSQGLEEQRLRVEKEMNRIYDRVWAAFGKQDHDGGPGRTSGKKHT
jgi:lysophospholipid acyltransferase (LPLAT)-like uncharacterized protein